MARDLHDTFSAGFTALAVQLETATRRLATAPDKARENLDEARMVVRNSLTDARRAIWALRPRSLDGGDLASALEEIAGAHDATPGQVALAWLAQQDRVVLLPRSTDAGRRRENLAALDVELTDEERQQIDELSEQRKRNFDPPFAPDWRD